MKKNKYGPECECLTPLIEKLTDTYGRKHSVVQAAVEWRNLWREEINTYNMKPAQEIEFLAERLKSVELMRKHLEVALIALPGTQDKSFLEKRKFKSIIKDSLAEIKIIENTLNKQHNYAIKSLITSRDFNDKTQRIRKPIDRPDIRIVYDDLRSPEQIKLDNRLSEKNRDQIRPFDNSVSDRKLDYSPRKPR